MDMAILLHDDLCWTYPTGGTRRVFKHFAWREVDSVKDAFSRPPTSG
jgi:hypothetical protein